MALYACVPKIPVAAGKLNRNIELMQPVVKNAKSKDTEPGCQAYFFFIPEDGNEEFLYGIEIYDDEKAIKDTHFNSSAFQSFAATGQKEGVNSGPPTIAFGNLLGGWLTRPNEKKRTSDQKILFAKYTLKPGKRTEFNNVLLNGLTTIDKEEQGTLSIVLIADDTDENVTYVMERFDGQAGLEGHMNGTAAKQVHGKLGDWVESREGGFFKEVAGFLSKDE